MRLPVLILIASLSLAACRKRVEEVPVEPTRPVLILSAFDGELERLLQATTVTDDARIDGHLYHVGVLAGQPVILSLTGGGVGRARDATEDAIAAFPVSTIVFVGVAGGIDPNLGVGDVVVPSSWAQHDGGGVPTWYPVDDRLRSMIPDRIELEACERLPPCAPHPELRLGGRGVSGSRFVADPAYGRRLWQQYSARVVDMETSAVAEVASANKLPFIAFRAISDVVATGKSREHVDDFWPLAASNASRVALGFFDRVAASSRPDPAD